jgi:hypothetical protein
MNDFVTPPPPHHVPTKLIKPSHQVVLPHYSTGGPAPLLLRPQRRRKVWRSSQASSSFWRIARPSSLLPNSRHLIGISDQIYPPGMIQWPILEREFLMKLTQHGWGHFDNPRRQFNKHSVNKKCPFSLGRIFQIMFVMQEDPAGDY